MLEVKFKKLNPNAELPEYAKKGDAGLDLKTTSVEYSEELKCYIYGTGLAVEIPKGYVGLLFPRSSIRKYGLNFRNCVGVIDSGYRGEIMVTFYPRFEGPNKIYKVGEKITQMIIMPYPLIKPIEVTELSETDRGENGHGSSGN